MSHSKPENLTVSKKDVFSWLGGGGISRNKLVVTDGFDWIPKSEARRVCGFEVLLLFEARTVVAVTCL